MLFALFNMSLLIACGAFWKKLAPDHIAPSAHRRALTDLVFYILLPALVLDVIWRAPLGETAIYISLLAAVGVFSALILMSVLLRFIPCTRRQAGVRLCNMICLPVHLFYYLSVC